MKLSSTRIKAFVEIQLREFYRDFGTLFLNLIFPLLFTFAIIISNLMSPTFKFKIGVVDERQDQVAQVFVQTLASSPSMDVKSMALSRTTNALRNGDVHTVFVIPEGSGEDLGDIELLVSPRYEEFSRILLDAARDRMNSEISDAPRRFDYHVENPDIEVRSEFTFTFPGLLALAMVQLGLFATAVPLLHARDRGTLRYLSLTPLSVSEILAGQLFMRVIIALVQVVMILLAGSIMLTMSPQQWIAVLGISLLGILLLVSIGYAIAGTARSLQMGMSIILVANFSMLMGGNIFIDANSSTAQYVIACIIPISYLADLYRQVITEQTGLWPIWLDVAAILAYSLVAITIALKTFNFDTVNRSSATKAMKLRRADAI